jgi:RNA polymerase sigma factor (sigma-70 family)
MRGPVVGGQAPHSHRLLDAYEVWRQSSEARWRSQLGEDAGDLLSEVYLRLLRAVGFRWQSEAATRRYIEQVASYVARDMVRAKLRRSELFSVALEIGARGGVSTPLEQEVNLEALVESAGLSLRQRVVVQARRQGMETREIGALIGASEDAVRQLESEAVRRLREVAQKGAQE